MPKRDHPLEKGKTYHIANHSVEGRPVFTNRYHNSRALLTFQYYRHKREGRRLSHFLATNKRKREALLREPKTQPLVDILCFCLMPNHYHLLLKQRARGGISWFVGQFQNSFTRYFNQSHIRTGPLFKGRFKAVEMEDKKHLLPLSRHLHLNPYFAKIVREPEDLKSYRWSSLPEYLTGNSGICKKTLLINQIGDREKYQRFVFDRPAYHKSLGKIQPLLLEEERGYQVF